MRSFCAGLASSTLGVRRGLGEEEKAEAERKRKREDSLDGLDIVPPSPELWGASGGGGGGGGYRDSSRSFGSSSSVSSTPPRSRKADGGGGGGGLSYRTPSSSRRSPCRYGDDGPDFEFETNEQVILGGAVVPAPQHSTPCQLSSLVKRSRVGACSQGSAPHDSAPHGPVLDDINLADDFLLGCFGFRPVLVLSVPLCV